MVRRSSVLLVLPIAVALAGCGTRRTEWVQSGKTDQQLHEDYLECRTQDLGEEYESVREREQSGDQGDTTSECMYEKGWRELKR